jgi:peroxiredoxin
MATESTMIPLGTQAPDFNLKDTVSGNTVRLSDFSDKKALLIMFICRHCPYVKHVQKEIAKLGHDYKNSNLGIIAISSNDPAPYPEDAPESLAEQAKELGFTFLYCFDETQEVGRAYHAACTPDFFLFDQNRRLVYRGQLDNSRPSNAEPTDGHDLRAAIDAVLNDQPVDQNQKPSMGCSIKWKE